MLVNRAYSIRSAESVLEYRVCLYPIKNAQYRLHIEMFVFVRIELILKYAVTAKTMIQKLENEICTLLNTHTQVTR